MNNKTRNTIFLLSAICVLIAAALYITGWFAVPYIFALGGAGIGVGGFTFGYDVNIFILTRLYRMETLSALLLVAASYFMFKTRTEWILLLTIAAILQLYTAILIPQIIEKDSKQ